MYRGGLNGKPDFESCSRTDNLVSDRNSIDLKSEGEVRRGIRGEQIDDNVVREMQLLTRTKLLEGGYRYDQRSRNNETQFP